MKKLFLFLLINLHNLAFCQELGMSFIEFQEYLETIEEQLIPPFQNSLPPRYIKKISNDSLTESITINYKNGYSYILKRKSDFTKTFYFYDNRLIEITTIISDNKIEKPEDLIGIFSPNYIIRIPENHNGILIDNPIEKKLYLVRKLSGKYRFEITEKLTKTI